jgi:hypothetical protein
MLNNFFFNCAIYEIMQRKYCIARQAIDTAHAPFMLDTCSCKLALRMCNTYCFSTATTVERTRLYVMLYIHCQSWFLYCDVPSFGDVGSKHGWWKGDILTIIELGLHVMAWI